MSPACRDFRRRLGQALSGRARPDRPDRPGGLGALSWHEHLLGCADCRALLAAEEALEALLGSLPEPTLPQDLAERVLARLELARAEQALDELLDRHDELAVPAELSSAVLAALRPHRDAQRAEHPAQHPAEHEERALERLLETLPAPVVPAGLAARVLAGLEPERARRGAARRTRPSTSGPFLGLGLGLGRALGWLVAAGLLALAWVAWLRSPARRDGLAPPSGDELAAAPGPENGAESGGAGPADSVPSEILATLDLLESWELVAEDDPDLALGALDEVDLLLLELEAEDS